MTADGTQTTTAHVAQRGHISRTVAAMSSSGIRRFFDLIGSMEDVISLGVGEPGGEVRALRHGAGQVGRRRAHPRGALPHLPDPARHPLAVLAGRELAREHLPGQQP